MDWRKLAGSHLGGADGVQGNGNGRGAARTRWLKLDSADSAPTAERTGDVASS